jgi:hypothetical protein
MNGSGAVKMAASPLHAKTPIFAHPVKLGKLEDRVTVNPLTPIKKLEDRV